MNDQDRHLTDNEILNIADCGIERDDQSNLHSHLASCWSCRARLRHMEDTIHNLVLAREETLTAQIPAAEGPRALLRAQLRELGAIGSGHRLSRLSHRLLQFPHRDAVIAAGLVLLVSFSTLLLRLRSRAENTGSETAEVYVPDRRLTPGATLLVTREQVCAAREVNDRDVPPALERKVLDEYGIRAARPHTYEIDYLIAPALGGADDIHNLWPQSYASAVWNAKVKDALEDRLRSLVCQGDVDLATAQKEISDDWIAAYKKYFRRESPSEDRR